MPKIHKKEFVIRQIISSINHPTSKLCEAADIILNPFIQSIKHILRDSQQLLQETEEIRRIVKLFLYSCDFESLYTNIRPDLIVDFLQYETDLLKRFKISARAVKTILKLIFTCNVFKFKNNFYLQLIGIPMGIKAGPVIANLYIYILEKKWLNMNPDIIYYRFIDDIFVATDKRLDLDLFKAEFLYLKLNIENEETVVFLDLEIKFHDLLGKFHFSLYIKPTNTRGYLLPYSNHPKHIFNNIVLSL